MKTGEIIEMKELFVSWLRNHPLASVQQIAKGLGIDEINALMLAESLCKEGIVERKIQPLGEGSYTSTFYQIARKTGE